MGGRMNDHWPDEGRRLKLLMFDFNWVLTAPPEDKLYMSAPHDWAFVEPREYFDWHLSVGNNAIFLMAYAHMGYAFYPTKLGPIAPGPGRDLLPRVFEMARKAKLPFYSYFCCSYDGVINMARNDWLIPNTRNSIWGYYLAPESPWTDLLCERIEEFLSQFPVDAIFFDWFRYGEEQAGITVRPAWFVEKPFREIIGRAMPDKAEDITFEESLTYRREIMARQFYRIRDAVKKTSPQTKMMFTPPYHQPHEPMWENHPMMNESDGLLAEYSKPETMEWLLSVRREHQCVIATPIGPGEMKEEIVHSLYNRGCGMNGYLWGTPPTFKPHRRYDRQLAVLSRVFKELP